VSGMGEYRATVAQVLTIGHVAWVGSGSQITGAMTPDITVVQSGAFV